MDTDKTTNTTMTPEEIERIASRQPGWEEDWGKLYALIGEKLDKLCDGRGAPAWPADDACEEFKAEMLENYDRRARLGELLDGYDPEEGALLPAIVARTFVYRRAMSFLKNHRAWRPLYLSHSAGGDEGGTFGDLLPDNNDAERQPRRSGAEKADAHAAVRERLDDELVGLKISYDPGGIDRIVQQAGLQLYPRSDWELRSMQPLRGNLYEAVPAQPPLDSDGRLRQHHETCRRKLVAALEKALADLRKIHYGEKTSARLIDRMNELTYDFLFRPFDCGMLVEIFPGLSHDNAAQRRKRYREMLPEFLKGNACFDQYFQDENEED